jgi:hypothetical protein
MIKETRLGLLNEDSDEIEQVVRKCLTTILKVLRTPDLHFETIVFFPA